MMLVQPDPSRSYPSQPSPPHLRIGKKEGLKRGARGVAGNKTSPFGVNRLRALSSTAQTGPSPRGAAAMRHELGLQEDDSDLSAGCTQSDSGFTSSGKTHHRTGASDMSDVALRHVRVSTPAFVNLGSNASLVRSPKSRALR